MQLFWYRLKEQFWAGQDRWGLWLPFFFACGIGIYFMLPVEPSKWATLAVIELLIVLAVLLRYRIRWLYALIVPAAVVAGFAVIQVRTLYLAKEQGAGFRRRNCICRGVSSIWIITAAEIAG